MLDKTVSSLDSVDEKYRDLYKEQDGVFVLQVNKSDGDDDLDAIKRKNQELLAEKKSEQAKRQAAEAEAQRIAEENARKNGDIESLEKSWAEKLANREAELTSKIESLTGTVSSMTIDTAAQGIASKIAVEGAERYVIQDVKARLKLHTSEDGTVKVIVNDKNGNASAMTLDELSNEFVNSPEHKAVIKGTGGSGGGATGGGGGNGGAKPPKDMTVEERLDWQSKDPDGFENALQSGQFE